MAMLLGADRVLERIEALWDELNGLEDRLAARFTAPPVPSPRLAALEEGVRRLAARQDEILDRLDRLAAAQTTYLGGNTALTLLATGHRIYVDTRDAGIVPHLMVTGAWEPGIAGLFRRLLRPGDRVLDLGANHGVYALLAGEAVGASGEVHAFEPNPRLAGLAQRSVMTNGLAGRVQVHALAAGEAEGMGTLLAEDLWSGAGHLRIAGAAGTPVRVVALDEFFPDPDFVVAAVKIAVEGLEGRALRGMRGLLERSPGVRIVTKFVPALLAEAGTPAAAVAGMLRDLGFRAWDVAWDGTFAPVAWDALAAEAGGPRNLLLARDTPVPGGAG